MHRFRLLLAFALAAALAPSAAAQQRAATLAPGDEVRVTAPSLASHTVQGTVLRYSADTLAVREADGSVHAFPLGAIGGLAKNMGMDRRRSVRRSSLLGLFVGAAVGLVTGPLVGRNGEEDDFGRTVALTGVGGAAVGLGAGAAMGALFPREHWQSYRTPLRVGAHASGGVALSLTVPAL
jgi:hypothetical protein